MMASADYRYTKAGFTNPSTQPGLERKFMELMPPVAEYRRVCDLGSGNGRFVGRLSELGYEVVGVDSSASGVELSRKSVPRGRFYHLEIDEKLPAVLLEIEDPFDVVVSSDVIEHMYRPRSLIEAARQLLRPGGVLIVGTPYHGYLKNLAISLLDKWDAHHTVGWDGGHIKFFSVATLGALVREHGFGSLAFHFYGRAPFLWKNMICTARRPVSNA